MKQLWLLIAPAAFALSSATPPPAKEVRLEAESVLGAPLPCAAGQCSELAAVSAPTGSMLDPVAVLEESAVSAPAMLPPTPLPTPAPAVVEKAVQREVRRDDDEARPEGSGKPGLRLLVSIPQQKVYVFDDGELVATSPVSTGKRGHETPAGKFRVLQKKVHHRSSKYDNAPMPYMHRLTNYGIAIHAGALPGYPASHGCIRLPRSFAKKLYGMTRNGTPVTITRARPKSSDDALRLA
jgi:lipoprotein-anchoring transpeptidase ErfK/SrfK